MYFFLRLPAVFLRHLFFQQWLSSDLILTFSSNPISNTSELINISAIKTMILPMEPYRALYLPKLLTKYENPIEAMMHKESCQYGAG